MIWFRSLIVHVETLFQTGYQILFLRRFVYRAQKFRNDPGKVIDPLDLYGED